MKRNWKWRVLTVYLVKHNRQPSYQIVYRKSNESSRGIRWAAFQLNDDQKEMADWLVEEISQELISKSYIHTEEAALQNELRQILTTEL